MDSPKEDLDDPGQGGCEREPTPGGRSLPPECFLAQDLLYLYFDFVVDQSGRSHLFNA